MKLQITEGTTVISTEVAPGGTDPQLPVQHFAYGIVIGNPNGSCVILRKDEWNGIVHSMAEVVA